MRLEGHIYCDGPDCECNASVGPDRFDRFGKITSTPGFLRVQWDSPGGCETFAFCSTDCLMKWGAKFPPPEIIAAGEEPHD